MAESVQNHLKTFCRFGISPVRSNSPIKLFTLDVRQRERFGMLSNALPKIFDEAQPLLDREVEHIFRKRTHVSMMYSEGPGRKDDR